ncbi:helix-turn-helix domain-containing protein [Pseudomonas guariconensis]|uniref:LexA family protein n=1 Tax=Pseudomonas guariconensis TaxID=1288410 RepID=UPI0018A8FF4E|nr:XRE family transcriptional regulator [Pseudomonas guariconensis]MBF8733080.1 helix-turn-helix domain-containing protein [Pseudomonas guariconensis]
MDIGQIIRTARKAKGWTLEELAHRVETDTGNLSRLERGKQGASKELLLRIMQALDIRMAAGQNGPGPENVIGLVVGESNVANVHQPARTPKDYPLISWVQAGDLTESPSTVGNEYERYPSPENATDMGFWLKVQGDSMTCLGNPSFPAGSLILVRPDTEVINGKYYVVEMLDSGEKTFKQYVEDAGLKYLRPLNNGYRTIEIDGNCRFIGRVIDTKMTGL